MQIKASDIAALLGGEIVGNQDVELNSVSKIEKGVPGSLSFLANPKYLHYIYETEASAVLVAKDFIPERSLKTTLIKVDDPYRAFTKILEQYISIIDYKEGIEEPSFISNDAEYGEKLYLGAFAYLGKKVKIGKNVKIYPGAYVGDRCIIGDNSIIYSGVKIYRDCEIGANCILHSGAVIGSDGFGFAPQEDGSFAKIPQTGNVILEDFVEVGANTAIDRATMGSTIIKKGVKLDNLIQIAHNVEIGDNTAIAAQTGVSGSAKIGKNCIFGGQVGVAGHITIADRSRFGAQSGLNKTITEAGKDWNGSPVTDLKSSFRTIISIKNLPELEKRVIELEKKLEAINKQ